MRSTPPSRPDFLRDLAAMAAAYRVGLAGAFAAWPVLLGRALFYGVCLLVLVALWDKVGAARLPGSMAARLPAGGLGPYIGVTEWVTLSVTAVQLKLEDDIRSGALEPHLLRPKSYLVQVLAETMGGISARLLVLGAAGLAVLAASGHAWPAPLTFAYVGVLGVIGAGLGMLLYAIVGLAAFWIRKVLPAMLIVQKLMFLLGGLFAPISLYPIWLRRVAEASPFGAHLAFVGQQVITPSTDDFLRALAWQGFWCLALGLLTALIWRAGLAKLMRRGI